MYFDRKAQEGKKMFRLGFSYILKGIFLWCCCCLFVWNHFRCRLYDVNVCVILSRHFSCLFDFNQTQIFLRYFCFFFFLPCAVGAATTFSFCHSITHTHTHLFSFIFIPQSRGYILEGKNRRKTRWLYREGPNPQIYFMLCYAFF